MTAPLIAPERVDSDTDNLSHYFCCEQSVALCGSNLAGCVPNEDPNIELPDTCLVCADLRDHPCGCACGCCPKGRQ